jgi:hypothetical protein
MKTTLPAATALLLALGGCGMPGPVSPVALEVVNQSDAPVCGLYVYPCGSESWGDNRLAEGHALEPGAAMAGPVQPGCWDFRALDCNQAELAAQTGNEVTGPSRWTLTGSRGEAPWLTLDNRSAANVCHLYISSCASSDWGRDYFADGHVVEPGHAIRVHFSPGCWDLKADDCDGNELATQSGLQAVGDTEWVLR